MKIKMLAKDLTIQDVEVPAFILYFHDLFPMKNRDWQTVDVGSFERIYDMFELGSINDLAFACGKLFGNWVREKAHGSFHDGLKKVLNKERRYE